jgi:signal transduction histidine kinase
MINRLLQKLTPPLYQEGDQERRIATITYLILVLLAASSILIFSALLRKDAGSLLGVAVADSILITALILTRQGRVRLVSTVLPIALLIVATYIVFNGNGIHDISMLSFPMIMALNGLLNGKRGTLLAAAYSTLCLAVIYWGEISGLIEEAIPYRAQTSLDDVLILSVLFWITATFFYFAMNSLSYSLETVERKQRELRQAHDDHERYASILEKRTEQLLTGAKVARFASEILDPDELGQQAVEMICSRFGLYFVSLYLPDEKWEWAILRAGSGKAGRTLLQRNHRLPLGPTSMIGWCLTNKTARIALDVGKDAVHFNNPLLPDTRSELALPLISRGQIIGALGIQSNQEAAFSEEDIASFQAMSDQLANAISNAQLYDRLQKELADRQRAEKKVRKLNKELEARVEERTARLKAANEHLTSLSRVKDEFVANVSHELRTPITSIMLYHSMIEKEPRHAPRYIQHLRRETSRLAHLIEDLLFLSRLDQGRSAINISLIDLNALIREYVLDRIPIAEQKKLNLELQLEEGLPLLPADDQLLGQVLSILLTNAFNYTPAGGEITIQTHTGRDESTGGDLLGFSIHDNGPGIPIDERDRVFERFFRGKAGKITATPGTGLGLAIAKEIVVKHNGLIQVDSTGVPGDGTTFHVWIPVGRNAGN